MANEFKIKKGLIVTGASGGTVVDIQGSQGQLFSVTDDLSGSIFAVSDISGVPIFTVNSSGLSTFDGSANFAGTIGIGTAPTTNAIEIDGVDGTSYVYFKSSAATTGARVGLNGDDLIIENKQVSGDIIFDTAATERLRIASGGAATFTGDVVVNNSLSFSTNGFADFGNIGTGAMRFKPSGNTLALTLTGTNATFAGKATSLATAASDGSTTLTTKSYVDGLVTGVPVYKGTWAAGTTGVTSAAINGTTITLTAAPTETIAVGDVVTADGIIAATTVTAVASQTSVTVSATVVIAITTTVTFSPEGGYPDLTLAAAKVLGNYYIVSTAGSAAPNGSGVEPDSWAVGDWCIFSDVTPGVGTDLWQRIDNSSVISGAGTGKTIPLWEGETNAVSETLGNAPITVSGNNVKIASAGDTTLILESANPGSPGIDFYEGTGEKAHITFDTVNNVLTMGRAGGDLAIDNSGNVGIGTTSPTEKLEVRGGVVRISDSRGNDSGILAFGNYVNGAGYYDNAIWRGDLNDITSSGNTLHMSSYLALAFTTSANPLGSQAIRMYIPGQGTNAGNVGIGTTSPLTKLHVAGTTDANIIRIENTSTALSSGDTIGALQFFNNDTTDDSPNVAASIYATAGASGGSGSLRFKTIEPGVEGDPATEAMIITNGGNVGIGTTGPTANLHISDTADAVLKIEGDTINSDETKGPKILLITDNGYRTAAITGGNATYETSSGNFNALNLQSKDIRFHTGTAQDYDLAVERMRITGTGALSFGTTGTAYGTSGQVLTSAGNASPTWTTPTTGTVTGTGTAGTVTKMELSWNRYRRWSYNF